MIPRLHQFNPVQSLYLEFIQTLQSSGFEGDLSPDYANRIVQSTDNSIYQILPQGILYPGSVIDLIKIAELSDSDRFQKIVLSPRGGGTGTNGQSLTDGLLVDMSRHMNGILEINAEECWARVESGVVKDQLNAALKPYGLFFAPELSTSNRATIGGMINTDASGQGSVLYGKTRDHVLELKTVLLDGSLINSQAVNQSELEILQNGTERSHQIYQLIDTIYRENQAEIESRFPPLNRCLTGYDLAHIRDESGQFNLNNILCGSEGTLGFIAEAKLNLLRIPKFAALVNVQYLDFEQSMRDAQSLMACQPSSIETMDSKVLGLAKEDNSWSGVASYFPEQTELQVAGVNLVEYTAHSQQELDERLAIAQEYLDQSQGKEGKSVGYTIATGQAEVAKIWAMRKKSVGLLGNAKGEARPVPFVEDTAVPPENLADFIMEFRQVLDDQNLQYGMFGHVDAGVLHVRPTLDIKNPADEKLIRKVTDQVVELIKKYNGLLWGEHGKGVRSEFSPKFFGPLYPLLQQIKAAFDPRNQLNPGKITTSSGTDAQLLKIDEVPMRGHFDRTILKENWSQYSEALYCNGNGACFNFDPNDAMCPSWKGTRERKYSPKGRASLIREWLRLMSDKNVSLTTPSWGRQVLYWPIDVSMRVVNSLKQSRGQYDYNHEVYDSMSACLACKSCTGACPIKVDVPEFRAKFLQQYFTRYLRPLKDYFIGSLEFIIPYLAKWPAPYNLMMNAKPVKTALARFAGMVDSPLIATDSLKKSMKSMGVHWATERQLNRLSDDDKKKSVILVQDAFYSYFDPDVVADVLLCLKKLGFNPMVLPYSPNGKPLHVHGFLKLFRHTADKTRRKLEAVSRFGIPLVGLDPSMTLVYRSEYKKYLKEETPEVLLIQEWLAKQPLTSLASTLALSEKPIYLLGHCTEKTNVSDSTQLWQRIFSDLDLTLTEIKVGCCGMAGTFGHETKNLETSKNIYQLSWAEIVNNPEYQGRLTVTGYSCRSQVKRLDEQVLPHPMQVILSKIKQ